MDLDLQTEEQLEPEMQAGELWSVTSQGNGVLTPQAEPTIIPFQVMGVVDVVGADIPDGDILAHALSNTA